MKRIMMIWLAVCLPLAAFGDQHDDVDAEIAALVQGFNDAYATNDLDGYFGYYTDDVSLSFFGMRQDVAAYGEEWQAMIAAGGGVEQNDLSDIRIQVMPGGETAVATYFIDNKSRARDGEVASAKAFETDVWQKIDGEWKIVSLHYTEI